MIHHCALCAPTAFSARMKSNIRTENAVLNKTGDRPGLL
jgi:hypothetical protein